MAKPKNPLLSFGAGGTLGDAITYSRRRKTNVVQEKPVPAYRRTLPQVYQRWLYQDYAAQWHALSLAEQRQWHSNASRYHMTGFAYFMSYSLKNLPDIAGWWRLDEYAGLVAHDSSKNLNHGTIVGALHVPSVIGYGLDFDGLNDRVIVADSPALRTIPFSVQFWLNPNNLGANQELIQKTHWDGANAWGFKVRFRADGKIRFLAFIGNARINKGLNIGVPPDYALGVWHLITCTFDGTTMRGYLNDAFKAQKDNPGLQHSTSTLRFSEFSVTFDGLLDNVIIYNRCLTLSDIQRQFERRYP